MITEKDKNNLLEFIERNVSVAPLDMDEGIGTVYERLVIDAYFRGLADKYGYKSMLEFPADGVTGVPGINSLEFARKGVKVTLSNPVPKMLETAKKVWERQGLLQMAEFVPSGIEKLPFADNSFDMAWNYCMFERFTEPDFLVQELKRVSRKHVMIMTQNCWNSGTCVHFLFHKGLGLKWDHGYLKWMRFKGIRECLLRNGLKIVETGSIDAPPWMDTWDMPLRGDLKKILSVFGRKWEWKIEETAKKEKKPGKLMDFLVWLEYSQPDWFKNFQAHHLFILAEKDD